MRCAIWYDLYNLKNVKNTSPWIFFTFFKLYKWYQIAQRITYIRKLYPECIHRSNKIQSTRLREIQRLFWLVNCHRHKQVSQSLFIHISRQILLTQKALHSCVWCAKSFIVQIVASSIERSVRCIPVTCLNCTLFLTTNVGISGC